MPRPYWGLLWEGFKSAATRQINSLRNTLGATVWQRNYYERILRNDNELAVRRQYIQNNPFNWDDDEYNPFKGNVG